LRFTFIPISIVVFGSTAKWQQSPSHTANRCKKKVKHIRITETPVAKLRTARTSRLASGECVRERMLQQFSLDCWRDNDKPLEVNAEVLLLLLILCVSLVWWLVWEMVEQPARRQDDSGNTADAVDSNEAK